MMVRSRTLAIESSRATLTEELPKVVSPFMKKRNLHPFLFAFFSFLLLFHLMLFWHAKDDALKGSADFSAFYSAVRMVRSGQGPQLYDIAAQGRMQSVLYPKVTTRSGTLIYDHPPFHLHTVDAG